MSLHTVLNAKRQVQSGASTLKQINKLQRRFNAKQQKGGHRVKTV